MAEEFGLGKSLLERLMALEAYSALDARVCVKLTYNYRSHPAILKLPSRLFYNNDLVAKGDEMVTHSLSRWEGTRPVSRVYSSRFVTYLLGLVTPNFPLIFHGVVGKDQREGNSPSWFNIDEIAVVMDYVKALLQTRTNRVLAQDIGIISPYRKQVEKLRGAVGAARIQDAEKLTVRLH